jgi:hypothetical protein
VIFRGDSMKRYALVLMVVLCCGCMKSLDDQAKKDPKRGIIGKTTQDVGKFDPNAKQQLSDSKIHATDPITAPVMAYGPMVESLMKSEVKHAVDLFEAAEGRYPKDYDEFMQRIIKENNIRLPVLPFGNKYQYDETNHILVVVKGENAP